MSALAYVTIYLTASLFSMSLAVAVAHVKRRTWVLWGLLSLFFPPFVLVLILLPKRNGPAPYERESERDEYDNQEKDGKFLFW